MGYVVAMENESQASECPRCKLLEGRIVSLKATVELRTKTVQELNWKLEDATRSKKRQAAPSKI